MNFKKTGQNIFSIFLGFGFSLLSLEIFTRLLPATDSFALELPIECDDLKNINQKCLHRRKKFISGRFTKGKFPPFEIDAQKSANDIGQFSNVDLSLFSNYEDDLNKIRIVTIGDSQVEALQVDNDKTFHGLFNNKTKKIFDKKGTEYKFISTSLGSSGMAFPNYIQYLKYILKFTDLESDFLIISIQANDFDESFEKYGVKGRRAGRGQFFFSENDQIIFKDFPKNNGPEKLISLALKHSYLARYLTYNVPILQKIKKLKIYCLLNNKVAQCKQGFYNHAANVVDESYSSNPERYETAFKASKLFLKKLEKLRQSKAEKKKTLIVLDADRGFIRGEYPKKGLYFDAQRNYVIEMARKTGFTVIDLESNFTTKYNSGFTLNSKIDGHWNESGHLFAHEQILEEISKIFLSEKN